MLRSIAVIAFVAGILAGTSRDARAQTPWLTQQTPATMSLAGPRVGVTFLSDAAREKLLVDRSKDIGFAISQFGWQKEKRFLSSPTGWTGVTEFVFLAGGLDQGILIPSFNWLVGMRTGEGVEFAAGPNVTPAGVAVAIAGGITFRTGNLNIPVNLAMVPSRNGSRISMLVGFNARRP